MINKSSKLKVYCISWIKIVGFLILGISQQQGLSSCFTNTTDAIAQEFRNTFSGLSGTRPGKIIFIQFYGKHLF